MGAFGILTLALALLGVYGVMSAVVGERTREYGIRLALGATRQRVNRQVLRQASRPIAAGLAGGLLLAVWGSRYIASLLFGIVPLDVTSYLAAGAIVMITGIAAALGHPRQYIQIDDGIGYAECGYCDRRFVLRGGVADVEAGGDPAAHGPQGGYGAPDHA